MNTTEVWRDIKGYEGYYQISNLGRVRSVDHIAIEKNTGKRVSKRGRILRQSAKPEYCLVRLCRDGIATTYKPHRLVALAFLEEPTGAAIVNHINGNKLDNRAANLEWSSNSHNMLHAYRLGLKKPTGGYHYHKNIPAH